jgi:hypothetical protein
MASLIGIYLLIGRILQMAIGIACLSAEDSFKLAEIMFCTPETSACEPNRLHILLMIIVDIANI